MTVHPGPDALARAIAKARPGDVLTLQRGRYAGPVTIDKPLTLIGQAGRGRRGRAKARSSPSPRPTSRSAASPSPARASGSTGSTAASRWNRAPRHALVEGNRLLGNLIGIDVQGARDATVRGNTIDGRDDLRVPERGPGIYVWNAPGLLVEGNHISKGRDGVFVTTSNKATYRHNRFTDLRFAFHSMYSNDLTVEDNVSRGNTMGFALMYSRVLRVTGNLSDGDSAHGFFMNFANHAVIAHNEVRNGGEKCLFVYNSNNNRIAVNRFQGCGIGVHFTAGSEGNVITGNAFIGNRLQVKYVGTRWLEWSEKGRGNYWSDHVAFDIDGDGTGRQPLPAQYRDRPAGLVAADGQAAAGLARRAADPLVAAALPRPAARRRDRQRAADLARRRRPSRTPRRNPMTETPILKVAALAVRYGRFQALDDVTPECRAGRAGGAARP